MLLDEAAMTTLDNLVHSRELAERRFGAVGGFLVCCDRAHHMKVTVLSRLVLRAPSVVMSVERPVHWVVGAIEPFSIVLESVGAMLPPLRRMLSRGAATIKRVRGTVSRSVPREAA